MIQRPWWGATLKILACLFFSLTNVGIRSLSSYHHAEGPLPFFQVAFLQNLVGFVFVLPWLSRRVWVQSWEKKNIHILRVFLSVMGITFWYAALSFMPVAESVALSFTNPIFALMGARFFLQESLGLVRALAIGVSFLGALCISHAKSSLLGGFDSWLVLLPLLSAAFFAGTKLTGRLLAMNGESAREMTALLYACMVPLSFIPAIWVWRHPSAGECLWLLGIGASSVLANILLAKSYAYAEVSFLAPFGFAKFFFGMSIAYWIFGEWPQSGWTWIGFGFILLSVFLLYVEQKNFSLCRLHKASAS